MVDGCNTSGGTGSTGKGAASVYVSTGAKKRYHWIRAHGLTLTGLANFTVPVTVTVQPETVQEADALRSVRHLAVGSVLSVQNGVFKNEQLARYFGWEKILGATSAFNGFIGLITEATSPTDFFAPQNVQRLLARPTAQTC